MHQKFLSGILCGLLAAGPQPANAANGGAKKMKPQQVNQLQGDQRIEYALDRLTFGPRPGDLDSVRKTGLENWFEDQLHPEQMDESALTAKLAEFPSIQRLSAAELMVRFPDAQRIRQAMNAKVPMPGNATERKIYEVQMARLREKESMKAESAAIAPQQAAPPRPGLQSAALAPQAAGASTSAASEAASGAQPASNSQTGTSGQESAKDAQQKLREELRPQYEAAIQQLLALPPEQRLRKLLAMPADQIDRLQLAMRFPERQALADGMSPDQREILQALGNARQVVVDELTGQRVTRAIYANAQLQEVMTDFWLNHFNIYIGKGVNMPYYLAAFERETIRPHALGKFEDLLEATAHSPAMMLYLDNASSIGPDSPAARNQNRNGKKAAEGLNENYARELMELHTVGVNGGYTQADVTEVAKILTGWGVEKPFQDATFRFEERRHEPGTKTVMGVRFKEDGENEGRELLHFLATRPATAGFISRKLAVRFVSDNPPPALVGRMAKSYLSSDGDIKAVLRTMFHSPEFWSAENYRAKLKTPEEFVISAVRASGIEPKNPQIIVNAIRNLGMPLYGAIPPTGYSWKSEAWVNTGELAGRMNFALSLAGNHQSGSNRSWSAPPDAWNAQSPVSVMPASEEARIEKCLLPGGVSAATRQAILQQIVAQSAQPGPNAEAAGATASPGSGSAAPGRQQIEPASETVKISPYDLEAKEELIAGLIMGSPEFQRR